MMKKRIDSTTCEKIKIGNVEGIQTPMRLLCNLRGSKEFNITEKSAIIDRIDSSFKPLHMCSIADTNELNKTEMFVGSRIDAQLQRPAALTAILNLLAVSEARTDQIYSKFLQSANISQQEIANACIGIKASYMYTSTNRDAHKKLAQNSSIIEIFSSYSKLFSPTFRDLNVPLDREDYEATIHIQELLQFCDDFEIYPRLLAKADIKYLWSAVSLNSDDKRSGRVPGLNMEGFKDILVRIALLAYHRPRAKELILRLNSGIMPSHVELVEYLCRYLHLDDQNWIMMLMKSKKDLLKRPMTCIPSHAPKRTDLVQQAIPQRTFSKGDKSKFQDHTIVKGANARALPFLKQRLRVQKVVKDIKDRERELVVLPSSVENVFQSMKISDPEAIQYKLEMECEAVTNEFLECYGDMTDEQRQFLSSNIDVATIRCFRQYTCEATDRIRLGRSDWFYPGGNFVDMGCLRSGTECVIRLCIMNRASDELFLDVSAISLDSNDARIISDPSPVIPGLSKTFRILFTVEPGDRAVVGYVQVLAVCVRTGVYQCIHTPVHYRIGIPNPERDDCPYTVRMRQASHEEIIDYRRNSLNFETKRRTRFKGSNTGGFDFSR